MFDTRSATNFYPYFYQDSFEFREIFWFPIMSRWELYRMFPYTIKIIIENSEEDVVRRETLPSETLQLKIDISDFLPGRYYWKLKSKIHGTILGMFFVQKNLMPQKEI